jgi:hypothetical protein
MADGLPSDAQVPEASKQPEHDQNEDYQTKRATEPRTAISVIAVIAAATEQKQEYHDNQ